MALEFKGFSGFFSTILTGTIPAFTAAGIVATLLFKKMQKFGVKWGYLSLIILGLLNLIFGIATRPIWGISKIQGTPSWLGICTGIGFILFGVLYCIADEKKHSNWAKIIAPAGTATLTCYMIPYFIYPLRSMSGIRAPEFLSNHIIGLSASFAFALLVVIFTGWLEKKGFKLKL
jgi:predicted acyltransferase